MKAYSLANRFLTILPWPAAPDEYGPREAHSALVRFPLVGLALGLILVAGDTVLGVVFPSPVRDGFIVIALIVLSGGKPLGAVSAWADVLWGKGGRFPSLPAAAALAGILLFKFAALLALPDRGRWSALILAPVLGRAAMAYLIVQIPGAGRREGAVLDVDPSPDDGYATIGWTLAVSLVFGFIGGIFIALLAGAGTMALKRFIDLREGEDDADVHSAAGEVIETAAFLLCSAWWGG
ncbi:adenosylcobinamide-GDP ribazoletransferase [Nitrospinota bacterium]